MSYPTDPQVLAALNALAEPGTEADSLLDYARERVDGMRRALVAAASVDEGTMFYTYELYDGDLLYERGSMELDAQNRAYALGRFRAEEIAAMEPLEAPLDVRVVCSRTSPVWVPVTSHTPAGIAS